jgi:hypothetical protein
MRDSIVDAILELEEGDRIEVPFDTKKEADSLRTGLYRRFQALPDNMKDDLHIGVTTLPNGKYRVSIYRADILSKMLLIKSTGEVLPILSADDKKGLAND